VKRTDAGWLGLGALAVAYEAWMLRRDDGGHLSERTRRLFRTRCGLGRASFLVALAAGAAGFAFHILDEAAGAADDVVTSWHERHLR
jgi:hypothetical protein